MIIKKVQKISIYLIYLHPVPISGFPLAPAKDTQQLPGVRSPKDTWCLVVQAHEVTGSRFHKARAHQEMACWSDSSRPRHKRPETEVPWISLKDGENMTYSPHKTSACLMGRNMDCEHTHTPLKWQKLQQGLSIRRAVKESAMLHNSAASVFSLQKSLLQVVPHKNLWILWQEGQSPPWHAAWVLFVDAPTAEGSSWDTLKGWHTLKGWRKKENKPLNIPMDCVQ